MKVTGINSKENSYLFFLVLILFFIYGNVLAQTDWRTQGSGNWNDYNNWQYYDGDWQNATETGTYIYPGSSVGNADGTVTILSTPHNITLNISPNAIGELVIETGASLIFYSTGGDYSLDVNGDITNAGTITSDDGGFAEHTIFIAGNFNNTGGIFNGDKLGGSEAEIINFNFDGTGAMTISGSPTFFKLTYSDGGDGDEGSLTTGSSSIVIKNSLDVTTDAGDFILDTGGLVIEGETINILGTDFIANPYSTLTFQGTSIPTLNTSIDPFDLYNLVIKDADLTLDGNGEFNITNQLTLTNTHFDPDDSETLSYDDNATLVYNGTDSTQSVGIEWTTSVPAIPDNVIINNAYGVKITGNRSIDGNLYLTNGELYHHATGGSLTVNGNIIGGSGSYGQTNGGTLILNGDLTSTVTVSNTLTLHNLTVNKTNNSDVLVTVQSGATINIDNGAEIYIQEGTLRFSTASQLVLGSGNILDIDNIGILETGGTDISGFETFDLEEGSTIRFTGTNNETVPNATYGNLTINKTSGSAEIESGGITLIKNNSYNSTLYIQNGALNLGDQTISFSGTVSRYLTIARRLLPCALRRIRLPCFNTGTIVSFQ